MAKPDSGLREALEDRDPNRLNQHIQIVWDDIVGEPEGARSPECAWRLSHLCFEHARNLCYTLLAVLAAPPCALLLGCGFACLAFEIVRDDIVGEPEGARSPECAWRLSHLCFEHARNLCYTLLAVLAAPPCALLLGCGFACLAFEQIWCTTPCLRCLKIYCASLRTLVQSCMAATVAPTMEAVGHVCRHIRVNMRRDAPEERDLLVV